MVEEHGTVVELMGKHAAKVMCERSSFCEHCAAMESCHIGDDSRIRVIEAANTVGAKVGDRVKLTTSTKTFLQSSFLLYGVPLIGLLIGAIAGEAIGRHMENGPDPNLLAALVGVAFLVGTFLVIRIGSRALPKEAYMPRIAAIVPREVPGEKK